MQWEAIQGVLNRKVSSVVEAHWLLCGEQIVGQGWKPVGGHTGSREMESSRWKLADGLMWEVRKKKQEGALGFRLELLGDSDVY